MSIFTTPRVIVYYTTRDGFRQKDDIEYDADACLYRDNDFVHTRKIYSDAAFFSLSANYYLRTIGLKGLKLNFLR